MDPLGGGTANYVVLEALEIAQRLARREGGSRCRVGERAEDPQTLQLACWTEANRGANA
jgi:hypothetical protein